MLARLPGPALTVLACLAIWGAHGQMHLLRGSVLWDLRYLVLGVIALLALSLAEWIAGRIARR